MKISKLFFIFSLTILIPLYSCGNSTDKTATVNPEPNSNKSLDLNSTVPLSEMQDKVSESSNRDIKFVSDVPDVLNRMIIKTGTMNLETEKYDETINQINDYVKKNRRIYYKLKFTGKCFR